MSHLLIVEDQRDIRESMAALFRLEGYEVSVAREGGEALQVIEKMGNPPDLIVLDLLMPGMDGYEFRRLQLEHNTLHSVPTIVLSCLDESVDRARGIDGIPRLQKPVEFETLLQNVRSAVGRP